mmetsp:Transcript_18604/g.39940  ORF Transcript_18604/g.39940 Transcript_18604/m.39940 type:complete len:242 (+) Transcript_18604:1152-1877(+)
MPSSSLLLSSRLESPATSSVQRGFWLALAFSGNAISVRALNCAWSRPARMKSLCWAASSMLRLRSSNRCTSSCSLPARMKSPFCAASCICRRFSSNTSGPLAGSQLFATALLSLCSVLPSFGLAGGFESSSGRAAGFESSSASIASGRAVGLESSTSSIATSLPLIAAVCGMDALPNSSSSFGSNACRASICRVPALAPSLPIASTLARLIRSASLLFRPRAWSDIQFLTSARIASRFSQK